MPAADFVYISGLWRTSSEGHFTWPRNSMPDSSGSSLAPIPTLVMVVCCTMLRQKLHFRLNEKGTPPPLKVLWLALCKLSMAPRSYSRRHSARSGDRGTRL
jgi:hypothetical protein